jgi:hypothetical protein
MDLFDELESLAATATYEETDDTATNDATEGSIKTWRERFGYTHDRATEVIRAIRSSRQQSVIIQNTDLSPNEARRIYILKLERLISTPEIVQVITGLSTIPKSFRGRGENGDALFCEIDGRTKFAIENWLSIQRAASFRPLFVPDRRAYKEISPCSLYPTLNKDSTLPQYRPQDPHLLTSPLPTFGRKHDQFPVWYFFYGTLASVTKLCTILTSSEDKNPILHDASVRGGKIETWGAGKYKALINGPTTNVIKGSAYQVVSEEDEDALRRYETDQYEVVRCSIEMNNTIVEGCTFRFIGETDS